MKKYRKKPVVNEAIQWDGVAAYYEKISEWSDGERLIYISGDKLVIRTLEGEMTANVGDWIIKGVKGEFYPCKPDIFEMTYERVE